MTMLRIIRGEDSGNIYELVEGTYILGRDASSCDILLAHHAVSRQHAQVERAGDQTSIVDLDSRNGTIVNGQMLAPGPNGRQLLAHNDRIEINGFCLKFEEDSRRKSRVILSQATSDESPRINEEVDLQSDTSTFRLHNYAEDSLRKLIAVIDELLGVTDLKDVFEKSIYCLLKHFPKVDCGFIAMREADQEKFTPVVVECREEPQTIRMSQTLVNYVAKHKRAILSEDVAGDHRFKEGSSARHLKLRAVICAPLINSNNEVFGIVQLEIMKSHESFTKDEFQVVSDLTKHVSVAIENAQLRDQAISHQSRNERRLQTLIEHAPEAVVVLDALSGKFVDVNENAVKLFGASREELCKLGPVDFSPSTQPNGQDSGVMAKAMIEAALAGEIPVFEWTHCNAEGQQVPCEVRLVSFPTSHESHIRGSVTDITERKRAQHELKDREQRLQLVLEQVPAIIWTTDCDLVYTSSRGAGLKMVGRKVDEPVGQSLEQSLGGDESAGEIVELHRKALLGELVICTQQWGGHTYQGTVSPLRDSGDEIIGTIGIAYDITERRQAEDELKLANEKLEKSKEELEIRVQERTVELKRSNADLEQFAYIISHDLQEPLRSVASFCGLIKERYQDKLDQEGNEFIDFSVQSAKQMQKLIHDLLDYSRAIRERPQESVDSQDAVNLALAYLDFAIEKANAEIKVADLPTVTADRTQLVQIFQNLISNSIKFRSERPSKIEVRATDVGKHWQFEIADNGIGLDPKHFDRIFKVFQQLHNRDEIDGTGIGLAICKKVVERHGGRMWVESSPGEGASFFFTLPKA